MPAARDGCRPRRCRPGRCRRDRRRAAASRARDRRSTVGSRPGRRPGRCRSPKPSGPRWRIARAIRSSACSSTGIPGSGRTIPAMPHIVRSPARTTPRERAGRRSRFGADRSRRRRPRPRRRVSPTRGRELGRLDAVRVAPHQLVHPLVGVAEVELLLALRQREGLGRRGAARDRLRQPELPCQRVDLTLVEAGDRLHVGESVAALDEEPLVVLEQVRRADHRVGEPVGPRVLAAACGPAASCWSPPAASGRRRRASAAARGSRPVARRRARRR